MDLEIDKVDKLKVVELRTALGEAGLDTKGTKPVLVARLKSYLESKTGDTVAAPAATEAAEAEKEPEAEAEVVAEETKPDEPGNLTLFTFNFDTMQFDRKFLHGLFLANLFVYFIPLHFDGNSQTISIHLTTDS